MGKIDTLNGFIKECEEALSTNSIPTGLVSRIIAAYGSEIKDMIPRLANYNSNSPSYIEKIMVKLINYKDNIEMEEVRELRGLEKLKLQSAINITNNNNSNANINISVSLVSTLERLQALPSSIMNDKEKEELEDKLTVLQAALDKGDAGKVKSKLTNILKYIGDKCIDVGITLLPYLGTIANSIGEQC